MSSCLHVLGFDVCISSTGDVGAMLMGSHIDDQIRHGPDYLLYIHMF